MKVSIPFLSSGSGRRPGRSRDRRTWALLLLGALVVVGISAVAILVLATSHARDPGGTLVVHTAPEGARLTIDGRGAGQTPAVISVGAGEHAVTVSDERYLPADGRVQVVSGQVATLAMELWRRTPDIAALRPSFPGATLESVDFLDDGRVAVGEVLPPGQDHQIWELDWNGTMRQVGPPDVAGPISLAPDGQQIAYFVTDGPKQVGQTHFNEIAISGIARDSLSRRYRLPSTEAGQLSDLSWASDGRNLLVTLREESNGSRTRFLWLDVKSGQVSELVTIPADVVHDGYSWSPDGHDVAFLTRTRSLTSLCVLDTARPDAVAYLTDLGREDANPLPFPPLAWSADGRRLIYAAPVAPTTGPAGWLFGAKPVTGIFEASLAGPLGAQLSGIDGQAPTWRADGTVVAAVSGHGGTLDLRERTSDGIASAVGTLPVSVSGSFAIRWDVHHGRAIVVSRSHASTDPSGWQLWLVDFRPERMQ